MLANVLTGLDKNKLRRVLLIFFIALALPTALLIHQSSKQLKWQAFHQYQNRAVELVGRIDSQISKLIADEALRPFTDYSFLNVAGDPSANFLQRSPLSNYPITSEIAGLIGYFQVDANGQLQTPLLPKQGEKAGDYGISPEELKQRFALQEQIKMILLDNHLVDNTPQEERDQDSYQKLDKTYQGQAAFDKLDDKVRAKKLNKNKSLAQVEELELSSPYPAKMVKQEQFFGELSEQKSQQAMRKMRVEKNALPQTMAKESAADVGIDQVSANKDIRINTFESIIDPFEFNQLASGHFVLFRKVWLNDQRYIQGVLIESAAFLDQTINQPFQHTDVATISHLLVVYQDNVLNAFSQQAANNYSSNRQGLKGELLYQTRLSAPLGDLQLLFSVTQLPIGAGGNMIIWLAVILSILLCVGFYWMYRLGLGQIKLVNQQQDFVSSVSHELKTPLTSIRMYGELLKEGWATEDKKQVYYNYIFDESERLSRLINNVLQLARMTRNEQQSDPKQVTVAELMDIVQSKISSQVERAGFTLNMTGKVDGTLIIDSDWFSQIIINLVDNALKFSTNADKKQIELHCQKVKDHVQFSVRDYGMGIDKKQMQQIFKLFYRSEDELTRETVGTGIGLALVQQMTLAMKGKVTVVNQAIGTEFSVIFPLLMK